MSLLTAAVRPVTYTPIFDRLLEEWRPRLNQAAVDVVEGQAELLTVMGGIP